MKKKEFAVERQALRITEGGVHASKFRVGNNRRRD